MRWFEGSIVEAITAAKAGNAIFVVYVHDSSESSTQTDLVLSNTEVSTVLSSSQFVAVKLENGSDGAKQFSQIYPLVLVPSLFFISGQSGVPLEIVGGSFSHDDLMKKLHKLNPTCGQDTAQNSQANTKDQETQDSESTEMKDTSLEKDSSQEALSSTLMTSTEAAPATQSDASTEAVPTTQSDASATQSIPAKEKESFVSSEDNIGGPSSISLDERLDRAKILVEEKQAQKQKEIEEDQKRKEIERREIGKDMAKQRQQQHEDELKSAAKERRKEKQDDIIARERVKAQIAADRADREARNAALRGEQLQSTLPSDSSSMAAAAASPSTTSQSQSSHSVCRIKFRLPDGSSSVAQFSPESSLSVVREHVDSNIAVPFRTFAMTSTMRPQPFTQDDMERSLTELDLAPSAILIITPGSGSGGRGTISTSDGSFLNYFWLILSPITFILGLLRSLFGAGGREHTRDPRQDQDFKAEEPVSKKPREEGSETTRKRPKTAYGSRREGNIHRFTNKDDEDDENGTWNGNSTQQM